MMYKLHFQYNTKDKLHSILRKLIKLVGACMKLNSLDTFVFTHM
jgi:hypothetical protein